MRKSREEALETRKRIVDSAASRFRENGIDQTALVDFMNDAGLTQGGFYKHFQSKDQLVSEALERSFEQSFAEMAASIRGRNSTDTLAALVNEYLSPKHRDRVGEGCPLSSLGTELRRSSEETSAITTDRLKKVITLITEQIKGVPPEEAKRQAHGILAAMVSGLILSRLTNSANLSSAILRDTRSFILD